MYPFANLDEIKVVPQNENTIDITVYDEYPEYYSDEKEVVKQDFLTDLRKNLGLSSISFRHKSGIEGINQIFYSVAIFI